MSLLISLKCAIVALIYLALAIGSIPGLRMNRTTIALVGSTVILSLGILDLPTAWSAIDANTIVFLLSMMIVNAGLTYAGFFQIVLKLLLRLTRSPGGLVTVITISSALLSAIFLNDTIALIFTPLILSLTQTLKLNPVPYLLAMAGATNLGSVATLSGNPQNIVIGSLSKIPYLDFLGALAPIAGLGLLIQLGLLFWLYPEVRSWQPLPIANAITPKLYPPLLLKTIAIVLGLLTAFLIGFPLAQSALVAASLLLITRRLKPDRLLRSIDGPLLLMFSGLFILAKATESLQVLTPWLSHLQSPAALLGVTTVLSNLISNVPAVLLIAPSLTPDNPHPWLLLAAGSTLAGNLTLFGSVANLITVEAAHRLGYSLTFWEHLRFGLPLTIATLGLTYFWLG